METQAKELTKQIKDNNCASFTKDDKNVTFKMILLDNVTYQNCIYSNYLNYLYDYTQDNVKLGTYDSMIQSSFSGSKMVPNTDTIPNLMQNFSNKIDLEEIHSKTVYNQSLIAYSEFENTYGLHILLLLIYGKGISAFVTVIL